MRKPHGRLTRYGAATVAVVIAALLTRWLRPWGPGASPFFLGAVAFGSWYGGFGPGLVATGLSALTLDVILLGDVPWLSAGSAEPLRLAVFGLVAVLICTLYCAHLRSAQVLADALRRERQSLRLVERAACLKDRFLATLGHELRGPLGTIRNGIEVLARVDADGADAAQARACVDRQLRQVSRLMEDLLAASRFGFCKTELKLQRVELVALVRAVTEDQRPTLQARGLNFEVCLPACPLWLALDAARMTQVVANLLGNAAKFTDPGGRVTVAVEVPSAGAWVSIVVRDTGLGIDPEDLPHVFEPFVQGRRTAGRGGLGVGLGLALVRDLVAMHGGEVTAASPGPGLGTAFTVRLPMR